MRRSGGGGAGIHDYVDSIAKREGIEHGSQHAGVGEHAGDHQAADAKALQLRVQSGTVEGAVARFVDHVVAKLWCQPWKDFHLTRIGAVAGRTPAAIQRFVGS
ncbi:hypothetical protein D3C86_2007920 [compost metagenome]